MNKNYINNMKVLNLLFLNRRTVDGETYCPFSQTEMAAKLGLSIWTVNNCIRHLSDMGFMTRVPKTFRKYKITEEGRKHIKKLK